MVETKYCTYLNKYLPITEFYKSQSGSKSKQYYRDNANRHTNLRIKADKAHVYRTKYNVPSITTYMFKHGDEVVYIGSSENTPMRIHEHYTHKRLSFCKEENRLLREVKYSWNICLARR